MTAVGHYRFALHPMVESTAFEARMSALAADTILQLTRVTSGFDQRLLEVLETAGDEGEIRHPRSHYVWEVTVLLVGGGHQYDFSGSANRVQEAVADLATLISVQSFRPVEPTG